MTRSFNVALSIPVEEMLEKAREVAREDGATFTGNKTTGTFKGKGIHGEYSVKGKTVTITITKKPFIIPWKVVETGVKKFFQMN